MFFKKRISKIIPSFFTIKEGSTFFTKPLFPQEREDVTALRCSEPLRYKVGGPIKGLAILCGMRPHDYGLIPQINASLPFSDIRNFIEYDITNLIIW